MPRGIIEGLDNAQRASLATHAISYKRLWSLRTGERLPTEVQTVCLAAATETNRAELEKRGPSSAPPDANATR